MKNFLFIPLILSICISFANASDGIHTTPQEQLQKIPLPSLETAAKVLQFDTLPLLVLLFKPNNNAIRHAYKITTISNAVINGILAKKYFKNDPALHRAYRNQAVSTTLRSLCFATLTYQTNILHKDPKDLNQIPYIIIVASMFYDIGGYLNMVKNALFKKATPPAEPYDIDTIQLDEESAEIDDIG